MSHDENGSSNTNTVVGSSFIQDDSSKITRNIDNHDKEALFLAINHQDFEAVRLFITKNNALKDAQDIKGLTLLHHAVMHRKMDVIKFLVSVNVNINLQDNNGCSALHLAMILGHNDIVELLGNAGALVNTQDRRGQTPLYVATKFGSDDIVRYLLTCLDREAIQAKDKDAQPSLDSATKNLHSEAVIHLLNDSIKHGDLAIVRILIENDSTLKNAQDMKGLTPLHYAVMYGQSNIIAYLFNKRADITLRDNNGFTASHLAIIRGNRAIIEQLIRARALVNIQDNNNQNLFHAAAKLGRIDIFKSLLNYFGNSTLIAEDKEALTPLHLAVIHGQAGLIQYMIDSLGIKILDIRQGPHRQSLLHLAAKFGYIDVVKLLVQYLDVGIRDQNAQTAMHVAAKFGHLEVVEFLVTYLAEHLALNIQDYDSETPLHTAIISKRPQIAQFLIAHFPKDALNIQGAGGKTPLHLAAMYGEEELVKMLVGGEAIKDIPDRNGQTPLHLAAISGHTTIVQFLVMHLDERALQLKDNQGQTPLDLATRNGHTELIKYLLGVTNTRTASSSSAASSSTLETSVSQAMSPNEAYKINRLFSSEPFKGGEVITSSGHLFFPKTIESYAARIIKAETFSEKKALATQALVHKPTSHSNAYVKECYEKLSQASSAADF